MLFGRKSAAEAAHEEGSATAESSRAAVAEPMATVHKQLGQLLIDEGLITSGQLEKALEEQASSGMFLGQVLVKQGAVTQSAVSSCLVKQCKIPHLSLLDYEISSDVLALVPEEICKQFHLLPIDKLGRILTVAMVDPLDTDALDLIKRHCPELKIKPILCNWEHYESVAGKLWGADTRRGGGDSMTAESLGLSKLPPAPRPTDPAPTPLPPTNVAAAPAPPSPSPSSSSSPQGGISARELSLAMRDAMQEAVKAMATQQAHPAAAIDLSGLGDVLKASVQEAVAAAVRELRPASDAALAAPVAAGTAPAFDPNQMAAVIQDSVGNAMQEAMALMVTQMKAMAPRRDEGQAEALAAAISESVREAIAATVTNQNAQGDRLAQIAEATLQSVQQTGQLLESAHVTKQNAQDLQRTPQARHASVSSFKGGASGTMDNDGKVVEALESTRPAESMLFDNFVPGNVNAFTFRVCQQVAEQPGGEFNPLFLFGHVGAGKTHLTSAIGNHVLGKNQVARVGYVSASHFARRLKDAMNDNALEAFRDNYAHWDVLILDDIQFLAGRVEAQEEFFHIFNALLQQGRQIIIASDKAPDRLGLLEQRLISRFASGIVAELKAPEWEARMTILRQQAKAAGANVPEQVLSLIAMRVADDVRKMTGSLRKVIAHANLLSQDLTCEIAEEILSHLSVEAAA